MNRVDEIMAELLAKAAALGVWLFGPNGDVISGAVKDLSVETPKTVSITGVTTLTSATGISTRSRSAARHSFSCSITGRRSD